MSNFIIRIIKSKRAAIDLYSSQLFFLFINIQSHFVDIYFILWKYTIIIIITMLLLFHLPCISYCTCVLKVRLQYRLVFGNVYTFNDIFLINFPIDECIAIGIANIIVGIIVVLLLFHIYYYGWYRTNTRKRFPMLWCMCVCGCVCLSLK